LRKLSAFNFITLNGFYKGPGEDITWHKHGEEEAAYSLEGLKSESILLFGRVTYEMMASYWPTPMALQSMPDVAKGMNNAEKIVFSKTLKKAEWNNTKVLKENIVEEIRSLKRTSKKDMTILGSGSIVTQCADAGLIDTYLIMLDPVAIANGTSIFNGLKNNLNLKLVTTRAFKSGVVLLEYEPLVR
jgi:dihydrofolate reductase